MRIGILTYHCVPNFGAQLQTISTVGYLKKMGHEPIVLHWYPDDLEEMYERRIPSVQIKEHNCFTKEVLPLSKLCRNEKELVAEIDSLSLDGIIVGSDALFKYVPQSKRIYFSKRKLRYVKKEVLSVEDIVENPFFGNFYKSLKRTIPMCAFSVSSQNCPYFLLNQQEREKLSEGIKNFGEITVRDEWTKQMVEYLISKEDIKVTPDPVFSFNQNCYLSIPSKESILAKYNLPDKYILLSFSKHFMPDTYMRHLSDEIESRGLVPVELPMPEGLRSIGLKNKINLPLSPLDWYALIIHSYGYIGERMHPIVVSIHNAIPFFCFDEYGTVDSKWGGLVRRYHQESSKTYHILNKAKLLEYLYAYHGNKKRPTSTEVVDKLLSFDKSRCAEFAQIYQNIYKQNMDSLLNVYMKDSI